MTRYIPILLGVAALVFNSACQKKVSDTLASKSAPHDMFAMQRSFPDREFDWRGWQKTMRRARQTDMLRERDNDCTGTLADWTLQGPSNIGGRVNALVIKPDNEQTLLAGFSCGGIFKTTDAGVHWRPVFDEFPELSIGDLAFDPSNPNVLYAGTGDVNMPAYVFNGEGLFKSTDAGETWSNLGLNQAGIISKIIIHPTQPQILYVAAMGNPYVRNNERGVYKSTDGGQNWQQVHFVSNQAGASDLVIDPSNPEVLYASYWDRIRNNSESVIFGNNARIYKTTDGGANWTQLGGGLPSGKMGRTGLVISQQNPQKLYALFTDTLSKVGGIYLTTNGGNTWNPFSITGLQSAYSNFGWYFGKLVLHPTNDDEVYLPGVQLWKKTIASPNWSIAGAGHPDVHDLVFTSNGRRYVGSDGGVYYQDQGSNNWTRCNNLPTTQFYRTSFNPHQPDTYYGGTQDNGTCKGNALTLNNWKSVFGSDGFKPVFHPDSAHIFWVETQNGSIHKTSDGGDTWQAGQECLGTSDRCNWDTPYTMSRHTPGKLYGGTYRMHSNVNDLWTPISQDLTDGNIFGAAFHTISCLDESPLVANKLFAGTSDANVW
ncbi:MAG: exo-alpha-sialidase, partial [Saprospiraceae bacterium]|nr:exo-alpha-sialidase [Saprospiraceae bacterium]